MDAYNCDLAAALEDAKTFGPDLIGMPLFSLGLEQAHTTLQVLRREFPAAFLVLGGPHATAMPDTVMEEFKECDFCVRGEAEASLLELVNTLSQNHSVESVRGLTYRKNQGITHNDDRPEEMELDGIPYPARHLVADWYRKGLYYRVGYRGVTDAIISARGCPYRCTFCFKTIEKFRTRSADNVLGEVEEVVGQGTRNIHFADDTFTANRKRCEVILRGIISMRKKLSLKVRSRASDVDRDLLALMKEANVTTIVYGFESGSQKMLDLMNKKVTVEQNYEACRNTVMAGIQCHGDMLLGYPGEDDSTMEETRQFILSARPTAMKFSVGCIPFAGTAVYEESKAQGTLSNDWSVFQPQPFIKNPDPDFYEKVGRKAAAISREYYRRPSVVYHILKENLFRTSFRGLWNLGKWYCGSIIRS
jgi:radical SAM superfamily enzyme YgiQ (UPF0313 family)